MFGTGGLTTAEKEYIKKTEIYDKLAEKGGCGAEPDSWADGWDCAISEALDVVENMPAADVVEVVRCKDCKNHEQCSVEFEFANYDPDNAFCWEGKRNG